jgi:hypothetical protein
VFRPNITKDELRVIVDAMSDNDFARFLYCQHMAATYIAVGQFEHMLISAMHMCEQVKIERALGEDAERWKRSLRKRELLQGSTLGSLIKILKRHCIDTADIAYLKWLKDKRDYFVHRLFYEGAWPGDLDGDGCRFMTRKLIALQHWLRRGERRVWVIFEKAGLLELEQVGGGFAAMNPGVYDAIYEDVHGQRPHQRER